MAESNQNKWIILLNKSPRGPFIEAEVKDLLKKGIVRHNDLAFLMPETGEQGQAQWKFLWQFPEFDSRVGEKENPPPAAVLEKRTPKTETQIKAQVEENVPVDLKSITIDDLILKVNAAPRREISVSKLSEEREKYQPMSSSGSPSSSSSRVASAFLGILALVGILYAGFKEFIPSSGTKKREVAQEQKVSGPTGPQGLPKSRSESPSKRPGGPQTPAIAPAERDRGQVREDEILRMREEERRREAAEREREREMREREEDNNEDEAESEDGPRKKAKGARKTASDEAEDPESEDKPAAKPAESSAPAEDEAPPASWLE
ncbi:MAG: DUF4339 domain-containing protein [Proteobacteria bacterium]|nr:DUF4339 domain-containing protein [Pseudomonadota bacterium]